MFNFQVLLNVVFRHFMINNEQGTRIEESRSCYPIDCSAFTTLLTGSPITL